MKNSIFTKLLIAGSLSVLFIACKTKSTPTAYFNAETFVPPYKLIVPDQWTTETFGIPIDFAPSIPYVGVEEVRFAPGWGDPNSEDYWTYAFLWYLDGKPDFIAKTMEENLEAYYSGLVGRNIVSRKIPKEKVFPVKANFVMANTYEGDLSTFEGSVHMLDYMTQQPITLQCLIHVKECAGKDNTFVFYEVSPKEATHEIWSTLNNIWSEFECESN